MSRPRNIAAIVLVVTLALALGSSAVLAPEADAYVSRSALTLVAGSVLLSHDGSEFNEAHEGDVIAAGDTIRTESGAAAEITYFEGSSVRRPGVDEVREPARGAGARSCARDPSRSAGAAGVGAASREDGCAVIGSSGGANEGAAGGSARHHSAEGPHDDIEDLKATTER